MSNGSHLTFVPVLIREFPRWLEYFEQHVPFTKPDQLALHRKTIARRRVHASVSVAIADSVFVEPLYQTLRAWGIGSRRSHLRPLSDFSAALQTAAPKIEALERQRIEAGDLDADKIIESIWNTIETLNVVVNDAPLVAGTKTLHPLLPELVPPMDRAYTQEFFRWQNPEFQYHQRKCFRIAFAALVLIAREANPRQYVGAHPWNTSPTKVLDNALVGLMCAIDEGVSIDSVGGKTDAIKRAPPKSEASTGTEGATRVKTLNIATVWNRIESHAGQDFATVTREPLTYVVAHGAVHPSRTNRQISRSDFVKALARVPLKNKSRPRPARTVVRLRDPDGRAHPSGRLVEIRGDMRLFPDDPTAFADGTWAAELRKLLLPGRLVPDWHPTFRVRLGTRHRWIQFEPKPAPGAFFWSGKPALVSSDAALFVGYYVERGLPTSHAVLAEQIRPGWHWYGFDRCLTKPAFRETLHAEIVAFRAAERRTLWIYSGGFPVQHATSESREIPYTGSKDLLEARAIIDTIPLDHWINVIVGVRFSKDECVQQQAAILSEFEDPIIRAVKIHDLVKDAIPPTP
jgi:hypothetical protein